MSIVDAIQSQLSDDALVEVSADVGESVEKIGPAIKAAVPAVLASLANSVLDGEKLKILLDVLRDFEGTAPVESLRQAKAGGREDENAGGALAAVLGTNLSTLVDVLAKFTAVAPSAMRGLLERLGPIILGAIAARLRGTGGLSPANLTSFFTAEKGEITRSLPGGLSLADLSTTPGATVGAAAASDLPPWLVPLLVVGLLSVAGFYYMKMPPERPAPPSRPTETTPDAVPIPPAPTGDAPAPLTSDEVSREITQIHAAASEVLAGVKDAATADAAAPLLHELATDADVAKGLRDLLSADARPAVAKVAREHLAALKAEAADVVKLPGVEQKLKPNLDALLARLAEIAD